MNERNYSHEKETRRRREDIAFAYFQGYTVPEIVFFSRHCEKTVKRDIEYIEAHPDEFLG